MQTQYFFRTARLYLLTISQGPGMDQSWGHSAVWLIDSLKKVDFVFEYTSTEKMRWLSNIKLLFGKEAHQLRITDMATFEKETDQSQQSISHLLITKDAQTIGSIYASLIEELKMRKKHPYGLATSNCSTLLFDHLKVSVKPKLSHTTPTIRNTFRSNGNLSFMEELVLLDILLSSTADMPAFKPVTPKSLETAYHQGGLINSTKKDHANWVGFIGFISFLALLSYSNPKAYMHLVGWASGVLGTLLIVAFFYATDPLLTYNHQLLWLNPLGILAASIGIKPDKKYLLFFTSMLLLSLAISLSNGHISVPFLACCLSILCINAKLIGQLDS